MAERIDPYAVLGVERDADADAVRKAYRQLAMQYHPDKNKDPGAEQKFKDVAAAYEILSDDERRQIHDSAGVPFDLMVDQLERVFSGILADLLS